MSQLRQARLNAGHKSLDGTAKKLGIHFNTLARYERGENQPPLDVLIKMADLYGVTLDKLAGREPSKAGA